MLNFTDILVIMVAYNPPQDILTKCQTPELNYLIIDNSADINPIIADYCASTKNCHYLPQEENTGIAKALNIGCEYAQQKGYKWVVTMDQDSVLTKKIAEKLVEFANNFVDLTQSAIISPRHVMQSGKKVKIPDENAEYTEGLYTMTSGNLLNLAIWKELGRFDEQLFIDMVDIEYYCRALLRGYKVITINHLEMQHTLGDLQLKKILGKRLSILNHSYIRKYFQVRNSFYVINKYGKKLTEINKVKIFIAHVIIKTLFFEKNKVKKIRYMWQGFLDYRNKKMGNFRYAK